MQIVNTGMEEEKMPFSENFSKRIPLLGIKVTKFQSDGLPQVWNFRPRTQLLKLGQTLRKNKSSHMKIKQNFYGFLSILH